MRHFAFPFLFFFTYPVLKFDCFNTKKIKVNLPHMANKKKLIKEIQLFMNI